MLKVKNLPNLEQLVNQDRRYDHMYNPFNGLAILPILNEEGYEYGNKQVPRVTHILSAMLHEDYLMGWSNAMGFKKRKYETILDDAANIGTIVHDSIDIYIKTCKISIYQTSQDNIYKKLIMLLMHS
jgi:hypothetical protein